MKLYKSIFERSEVWYILLPVMSGPEISKCVAKNGHLGNSISINLVKTIVELYAVNTAILT